MDLFEFIIFLLVFFDVQINVFIRFWKIWVIISLYILSAPPFFFFFFQDCKGVNGRSFIIFSQVFEDYASFSLHFFCPSDLIISITLSLGSLFCFFSPYVSSYLMLSPLVDCSLKLLCFSILEFLLKNNFYLFTL